MSQGLDVGRQVEPGRAALGARVELSRSDLLPHGPTLGMTGSGKTSLAGGETLRHEVAEVEAEVGPPSSADRPRLGAPDLAPGVLKSSATISSRFIDP